MGKNNNSETSQKTQQQKEPEQVKQVKTETNNPAPTDKPPPQPDTIVIKAFADHRIQVSYEFKGRPPREQKEIAHSILQNTTTGLFKELLAEEVKGRIMKEIEEEAKKQPKIITPNNFVVPKE